MTTTQRKEAGYVPCACRDCMEIAIGTSGEALCHECESAGCEANDGECSVPRPLVIGYMDDGTEDSAMPKLHRDSDGTLPRWAWPGGYPIIYVTDDGGTLCPGCANGENGSLASEDADPRSGWKLECPDIHWEGPPEVCDHCGTEVESAYGDPDAEE